MTQAAIATQKPRAFSGAFIGAGEITRALVGVCRYSSGMIFMSFIVDAPKTFASRFSSASRAQRKNTLEAKLIAGQENQSTQELHSEQPDTLWYSGVESHDDLRNNTQDKKENTVGRSGSVTKMSRFSGGSIPG